MVQQKVCAVVFSAEGIADPTEEDVETHGSLRKTKRVE
jgi:hypothetical protein